MGRERPGGLLFNLPEVPALLWEESSLGELMINSQIWNRSGK